MIIRRDRVIDDVMSIEGERILSDESSDKLPLLKNRWAKEASANSVVRPTCSCFGARSNTPNGPQLHTEQQDTDCAGWQRLNELIDDAARDGREEFSPGPEMEPQEWAQITVLPPTIGKLKSLKHLNLYGSSLVRIPPEIGELDSLEEFTPYTSYRLHWFPYELLRCVKLKRSTISTRALYGTSKHNWPFPRLPQLSDAFTPESCSVCRTPFDTTTPKQRWVSLPIGIAGEPHTDIVPLLVHACSDQCISKLPTPPDRHVPHPHCGGDDLVRPITEFEEWLANRQSTT